MCKFPAIVDSSGSVVHCSNRVNSSVHVPKIRRTFIFSSFASLSRTQRLTLVSTEIRNIMMSTGKLLIKQLIRESDPALWIAPSLAS